MINPLNYVKSYQECRRQKREIHSEKSLKNKIRGLVPNEVIIKSVMQQKHKYNHESRLLQLYKFWQIPRSQYEKIFSNPLYYMGNEMHFKMFKYFLSKNLLDEKLTRKQLEEKGLSKWKNKNDGLSKNRLVEYQFCNKNLLNYQQPWKFIDSTISKIEAMNKQAAHKFTLKNSLEINQDTTSNIFNPEIKCRTHVKTNHVMTTKKPQLKTLKSFSQSTPNVFTNSIYKQKILQRQSKIKSLKTAKHNFQESKKKSINQNLFLKMNSSQSRLKKTQEIKNYVLRQQSADLLIKTQKCKLKKKYTQKMFDTTRNFNEKIRQVCLKTTGKNKSSSLEVSNIQQNKNNRSFINKFSTKSNKNRIRQSIFRKYLQERLGIVESQSHR